MAGLMIAIALVTLRSERAPKMPPPLLNLETNGDPLGAELARCATITVSDTACEAVWDAHRRRFLCEDDKGNDPSAPSPDPNAPVPSAPSTHASAAHEPLP